MTRYANNWRQGDVLGVADAMDLQLSNLDSGDERVVVITHDCDLPHSDNEIVEAVLAKKIARSEPLFTGARHPRKLHLKYSVADQESEKEVFLELSSASKKIISKQDLMQTRTPDASFFLDDHERRTLKQWLASIYGRPAFPNAFENRIKKTYKGAKVEDQLAKILKRDPGKVKPDALFFSLGETRHLELQAGQPYVLQISVVYDSTSGGSKARQDAEEIAEEINKLFHSAFGTPDVSEEIALESCIAVADTFFSLASIKTSDQWRFEYISLQQEPSGEFIGTGELSA